MVWYTSAEEVTYYVKELKAPSHPDEPNKSYKPDSSVIKVTVSSTANATEATAAFVRGFSGWVNQEETDEHSEIKKVDASGNGIGIAKFNIRSITLGVDKDVETDASGNVPMQWTNPAGANYYEPGEYTVTEIVAPTGYEKDRNPKTCACGLRNRMGSRSV